MNKKLTDHTVSGFFWLASSSGLQAVLKIVFTAVLARLLTPADFGLIAAATIVTGFADLFSQFGVGPAIVQKKSIDKADISTAYTFSIGLGLVFVLLLYLINPGIARFFVMPALEPVLDILIWLFPVKAFSQVSLSLIQRDFYFRKMAGLNVLSYALGYGAAGITLALLDFGVMALVFGTLIQSILFSLLIFWVKPHSLSLTINRKSLDSLMGFGSGFTLVQVFNYLARKADYVVVGKYLGSMPLGIYSRAYGLMDSTNNILGSVLNTVLFPGFARIQGARDRLTASFRRGYSLIFQFFFPLSIFSIILAPELVMVLLGRQWEEAILPFQVLALSIFFRIGYKLGDIFAKGIGVIRVHALIQVLYFAAVTGGSLLGKQWGVTGVATAVSGAIFINFAIVTSIAIRNTDLSWKILLKATGEKAIWGAVLGIIIYLSAWLLRSLLLPPFAVLLLGSLIVTASALFLIWTIPNHFLGNDGLWFTSAILDNLRSVYPESKLLKKLALKIKSPHFFE